MLQRRFLCCATRFFTTQKIFSHREILGEAKKNRRRSVGFVFDGQSNGRIRTPAVRPRASNPAI
jgi:hypothetical protein